MKGARAKDARFEAPEASIGWNVGRGVPSPLKQGSGEGAVPPPQNLKKNFFGSMCSKNFCVQAKGGGGIAQCPPKYATGVYVCV